MSSDNASMPRPTTVLEQYNMTLTLIDKHLLRIESVVEGLVGSSALETSSENAVAGRLLLLQYRLDQVQARLCHAADTLEILFGTDGGVPLTAGVPPVRYGTR